MSAPYAAPERWRGEHATFATDVYSFGVIAYQLLCGMLPFPGPSTEDLRDQHLHIDADVPDYLAPGLRSLLTECLYKAPEARPRPANLLARLETAPTDPSSPAAQRLQEANFAAVRRRGGRSSFAGRKK